MKRLKVNFVEAWMHIWVRSLVPPESISWRCCPRHGRASYYDSAIAALAEGRDPGDLPMIEDAGALVQVKEALTR